MSARNWEVIDRRFYAATGITREQWRELRYNDPGVKELHELHSKMCDEVCGPDDEDEVARFSDERFSIAMDMLSHDPQSITDLAWQLEALVLADRELCEEPHDPAGAMMKRLLHNVRTLGALSRPHDPHGALTIPTEV